MRKQERQGEGRGLAGVASAMGGNPDGAMVVLSRRRYQLRITTVRSRLHYITTTLIKDSENPSAAHGNPDSDGYPQVSIPIVDAPILPNTPLMKL